MGNRLDVPSWARWAGDRFGLDVVRKRVLERRVVRGRWYQGDGAALLLLIVVQAVTGAVMLLTYSPSPERAYASVAYISDEQPFGWMVRGLHYWSAGLAVVLMAAHMFRQILLGGYKSPREGTWLIGVALLFAILAMSFTGYVLRWDERAIHALRVCLHMMHNVPWIGDALVRIVQGGPEISGATLTRVFAVHVVIIPLFIGLLIAWHLYLVVRHGVTTVSERRQPVASAGEQRELYRRERDKPGLGGRFFPTVTLESGLYALVVLLVPVMIVLVWGAPALGPEANLTQRSFPMEEWWFWWYSGLIALLPPWLAPGFVVVFPIALALLLLALPFIDRSPRRGLRRRPVAAALTALAIIALLALSDYRRQSPFTAWPSDEVVPVPEPIELSPGAEAGRQLFTIQGCNTCHAVGGHGERFAPDLARIDPPMSPAELRAYVLDPPADVAMPAYEGHLTQEELDQIVEFLLAVQAFPPENPESEEDAAPQ